MKIIATENYIKKAYMAEYGDADPAYMNSVQEFLHASWEMPVEQQIINMLNEYINMFAAEMETKEDYQSYFRTFYIKNNLRENRDISPEFHNEFIALTGLYDDDENENFPPDTPMGLEDDNPVPGIDY